MAEVEDTVLGNRYLRECVGLFSTGDCPVQEIRACAPGSVHRIVEIGRQLEAV